jgi:hypothetical protein
MPAITAPVLSLRSAPAEKNFGSSLPMTRPGHAVALDALERLREQVEHLGAERVALAAELEQRHAVAEVEQAGALVLLEDGARPRGDQRQPDVAVDGRHRRVPAVEAERLLAARARPVERALRLLQQRRHAPPSFAICSRSQSRPSMSITRNGPASCP